MCKCGETSLKCSGCQNWVTQLNDDQLLLLLSRAENAKAYSKGISSVKRNLLSIRLVLVIHKLIRDAWVFFRALQDVQIRFQPLHSPDMSASMPSHSSHEEFGEHLC